MTDIFKYDKRRKEIGERIRQCRKAAKLTQDQVAARVTQILPSDGGISQGAVSAWEKGVQLPPLPKLIALSEIFHCDIAYLLCDYNKKQKDVSDICELTGLSYAAVNTLIGEQDDGYHNPRIEALNFLLTSGNFQNALVELFNLKGELRVLMNLEKAKERMLSKLTSIDEYQSNLVMIDHISKQAKKVNLSEYNLSQHFSFIIHELKRRVEEERENG